MPSNVIAKIKWALKRRETLFLLAAVAVVLVFFVTTRDAGGRDKIVRIGDKTYTLEVAITDGEHEKGLSGRPRLADNRGMLFVFQQEKQECFWMKDMRFNLDIIWLDAKHRVVHTEHDVSPKSYPRTYCPSKPAAYVIELSAGEAVKADIKRSQIIQF